MILSPPQIKIALTNLCNTRDDSDDLAGKSTFFLSLIAFGLRMEACLGQNADYFSLAFAILTKLGEGTNGECYEGERFTIFILCGSCALFGHLHAVRLTLKNWYLVL